MLTPIWGAKHSAFKAPVEYGEVKDGAIVAFKVEEKSGKWQLTPAWISRDMNRAEPPVIANGVIFAYGNGEDTEQAYPDVGLADVAERRIPGSTHAVLYALDATDRQRVVVERGPDHIVELIGAVCRWLMAASIIGTFDSNLYCFGIKK